MVLYILNVAYFEHRPSWTCNISPAERMVNSGPTFVCSKILMRSQLHDSELGTLQLDTTWADSDCLLKLT